MFLEENTYFATYETLGKSRVLDILTIVIAQMCADILCRNIESTEFNTFIITEMTGIEVELGEFRDVGIFRINAPGAGLIKFYAAVFQGSEPARVFGIFVRGIGSLEIVTCENQILGNRAAEAECVDVGIFTAARDLEFIVVYLIEGTVKLRSLAGRISKFCCPKIKGFAAVEAGQIAA